MLVRDVSIALAVCGLTACGRIGYSRSGDDGAEVDGGADAVVTLDADGVEVCAQGELVCGDFEGGLGGWAVRGDTPSAVAVVSRPAARGERALRILTDGSGDEFAAAERRFAPVQGGELYGRVLLWVGQRTAIDEFLVAIQLDDGNDTGTQKLSIDLMPYGGFVLSATTATPAVRPGTAPGTVRRDDWMCLTFHVDVRQSGGSARVDEDGAPVLTVSGVDTVPDPGGYQRLLLGSVAPRPGVSEVAFDAVALSRQPLACP